MSLVSFVQGLILEHQSLTIWWGRRVSIYALMTAPISKEMDRKKKTIMKKKKIYASSLKKLFSSLVNGVIDEMTILEFC